MKNYLKHASQGCSLFINILRFPSLGKTILNNNFYFNIVMAYKESLKSHQFSSYSITDQDRAKIQGTFNTYLMPSTLFINAFVFRQMCLKSSTNTAASWMWVCKNTVIISEKSIIIYSSHKSLRVGIELQYLLFSCVVIQNSCWFPFTWLEFGGTLLI